MFSCVKSISRDIYKNEDGLTLMEVSLGLLVVSILALPLLQAYNVEIRQRTISNTQGALAQIEDSMNHYFLSGNGEYPCPASVSLGEDDPGFGEEGDCTLANIRLCTDPLWSSTEGICKTEDAPTAVIIGSVPFAELKMQQEQTLDYWGNKILYAVSFPQTNQAVYTIGGGTITVNTVDDPVDVANGSADGIPDALTNPYDIFMFSTGATGLGGYSRNGESLGDCADPADSYDHENCDFDNVFFYDVNPGNKSAAAFAEQVGPQFYDDMTRGQQSVPESTWFQHPDNAAYTDEDFAMTFATRIGIGTHRPGEDTTPDEMLHVAGNIRVETGTGGNGRLKTDSICDEDEDCFDPSYITEEVDEMQCDPDDDLYGEQVIRTIGDNQVRCNVTDGASGGSELQIDTSVVNGSCNLGERAVGFNPSGGILCL
ncbi:MAG: type II secretion system protein [Alphaproteobacteria bacterium]